MFILSPSEQSFVVDSSFLRIFIAWETFVETAFVSYLLGATSTAGRAAVRYSSPPSEAHARSLLIGTQKYVDWANPEIVRKLAGNHFQNGEPIGSAISSIQNDLFDLRTIRNAAAHLTATTSHPLDALASRRLQRVCTGISVSQFVLTIDSAVAGNVTVMDSYLSLLDSAAENIAAWK